MKIRRYQGGFFHWCPGCNHAHHFRVPPWTWDGNDVAPTAQGSMREYMPANGYGDGAPEQTLCHYILTAGVINFLADCRHGLAGQTVPLPDFPEDYHTPSDP